jgi:hypothetical protein
MLVRGMEGEEAWDTRHALQSSVIRKSPHPLVRSCFTADIAPAYAVIIHWFRNPDFAGSRWVSAVPQVLQTDAGRGADRRTGHHYSQPRVYDEGGRPGGPGNQAGRQADQ